MMRFVVAAVMLAVYGVGLAEAQVNQTLQVNKENRTISVTATDRAFAMADQAVVRIGYMVNGDDEQAAYAEGAKRSNAIVEALATAHVPSDAIESEDQNLQPLSEYEIKNLPFSSRSTRFKLTQSWSVRVSPEDAAKVLDVAVKAGANQSGSIGWEMKDDAMLEATAAGKALAHAQAIAAQMAAGLHIKVGPLLYASNTAEQVVVRPDIRMRAMAAPAPAGKPLAISTRRVERSATVFAVFAVE
jgi:uncharacterized protein